MIDGGIDDSVQNSLSRHCLSLFCRVQPQLLGYVFLQRDNTPHSQEGSCSHARCGVGEVQQWAVLKELSVPLQHPQIPPISRHRKGRTSKLIRRDASAATMPARRAAQAQQQPF